jgi:polysaccharide pyruvyl transferase WcaK-like protein
VARERGLGVRLVPWRLSRAGDDDLDLARAVGAVVPDAIVDVPPADLEQMRDLAAGAAVVVTSRLHALHASAAAGTPTVALSADEEATLLAWDLGQRSLHPDADGATIASRVRAALDGPAPAADVVAERVETAERSLRLLRLLLGRGATDDDLYETALPLRPAPEVPA